jgi:hypothetical protein
MNNIETMKLALEALETVTKEMLTLRDELAERGGRPQANEFHQRLWDSSHKAYVETAIPTAEALRQAINAAEQREQAQQAEPDYYGLTKDHLWMSITKDHYDRLKPEFRMACYTSPPPRQPLTDEEMFAIAKKIGFDSELMKLNHDRGMPSLAEQFARAIEAAHGIKEKNNG